MKKYFLALSTFAIISMGASAQSTDSTAAIPQPRMHMGPMMKRGMQRFHHGRLAMAHLNLTDAQKQQAKAINEDYHKKVADLEKDDNITLKDYRAQKAALEKERKDRFNALLTPEQKNKIEQGKKKMQERARMMADRRMQKMKTDLNLSEEQVAKIKAQRESMMQQAKAIKDNSTLSQEEKKEQFMALRKTFKDNMNSILTPEQIKKREELRNDRMNEWRSRRDNKAS
ncbi:MAG TPA: hypothetical protein VG847_17015 [Chitinophagaceae bacterium]|nr:hypothetical protein [Chitinophagaceae bacterium]